MSYSVCMGLYFSFLYQFSHGLDACSLVAYMWALIFAWVGFFGFGFCVARVFILCGCLYRRFFHLLGCLAVGWALSHI